MSDHVTFAYHDTKPKAEVIQGSAYKCCMSLLQCLHWI